MIFLRKYVFLDLFAIVLLFIFTIVYISESFIDIKIPIILQFIFIFFLFFQKRFVSYNFLVKLMILFFAAPILPLYGHLFTKDYDWTWLQFQRENLTNMIDLKIALIGLIGILSIYISQIITRVKQIQTLPFNYPSKNILGFLNFIFLLILSLFCSYLSAPANTIFEGAYYSFVSVKFFNFPNFNAGFLISYIILILLYLDIERDITKLRFYKKLLWYTIFFIIVIFLQLLRGDREFIGLILCLILVNIYKPIRIKTATTNNNKLVIKKVWKYILFFLFFIVLLLYIGIVRYSAIDGDFLITGLFLAAPWNMATLSFLAFFATDISQSYTYGLSYINYILSLLPTFFYKILNLDSPSWNENLAAKLVDTNLTSGGAHVALISISNFGIIGLIIIMFFYTYFAHKIEKLAIEKGSKYLLIWIGIICALPFWFWYGEMAVIRGVMTAYLLYYSLNYKLK
jgi:hypothetical protein